MIKTKADGCSVFFKLVTFRAEHFILITMPGGSASVDDVVVQEAKRKEIEKKLEDKARQEKEAIIKEKHDLKSQQRLARIKIRRLEQKMELAEIVSLCLNVAIS